MHLSSKNKHGAQMKLDGTRTTSTVWADLLQLCETILIRLDLEAEEKGADAIFPCAAMRDDLRRTIKQAKLMIF